MPRAEAPAEHPIATAAVQAVGQAGPFLIRRQAGLASGILEQMYPAP